MPKPARSDAATARNALGLVELAARATDGDVGAMGLLLKAVAPSMIRSAQQLVGSTHADLDDVVQQSLIGLVQALPSFRQECSVVHFACRIVARTAVASRRRSFARAERHDESVDVDSLPRNQELGEEFDAERRRELVRGLLSTLPEEQAETLALRIVLGFSLEEVALATGVPMNTVRSRVRLAKTALRRRIEADPTLLEALEVES